MFKDYLEAIDTNGGGLNEFTQAYKYYGMHVQPDNSIICREWAPRAQALFLAGDFSMSCFLHESALFRLNICFRSVGPLKPSI